MEWRKVTPGYLFQLEKLRGALRESYAARVGKVMLQGRKNYAARVGKVMLQGSEKLHWPEKISQRNFPLEILRFGYFFLLEKLRSRKSLIFCDTGAIAR